MNSTPQIDTAELQAIIAANKVPRDRYPVVVVALRGFRLDSIGLKGKNDRDWFDDLIAVVFPDGKGGDKVLLYNANTDPAGWKHGRATLCNGIHIFGVGPHNVSKGPSRMYPAYRQCEVFTVTRDGRSGRFSGFFGIDLHRATGKFGFRGNVDSAGCQTVPTEKGPMGWDAFKPTLDALLVQHGNELAHNDLGLWAIADGADPAKVKKVHSFPYILVDETERRKGNLVVSKRYF
jgi:hypothetical protein